MSGVKGKRWIVVIALLAVILLGWYLSVRTASGIDNRNAQAELVRQADLYAGKELYVRAVPLYVQALSYRTDEVPGIETRLQQVYLAQGDTDSYVELVEKRSVDGTASEEEYLKAAEIYLSENDLKDAMTLLKKGMELYPGGPIGELYEDNRYGYSMRVTAAVEITPTSGNSLMPAFDGSKWGYINAGGKFILPAVYDTAVPFNNGGYGVVSMDGTYYTILTTGEKYGIDETPVNDVYGINNAYIVAQSNGKYGYYTADFVCAFPELQFDEMTMNSCGVFAARSGDKWAVISDSGEAVTDYIYEDVAVSSLNQVFAGNMGMVKSGGLWYLIDVEGNRVSENGFADAKAPESSNYIAVADENGKWGFIDRSGQLVIDYQYNDAWSFSNHLAAVRVVDTWGYISERNELVITEALESAMPFHNYSAQVTFLDQAAMITLEYKTD
ncbi:MAG: WG repeat-containing protein [Acetatifactor sp.]|nr:WG repeat-containing protein [Acetatifactor sp.]